MIVKKVKIKEKILRSKSKFVIFGITTATLHVALCAFNMSPVHAEGVSLSTYPSTLQIRTQTSSKAQAGFTIENKSSEPIKLNIALKPFKADPTNDGKLIYIEGNDPPIFKKVQILDNNVATNSVELGPKQSKQLKVEIAIDEPEPTADYYFSIIFLPVEPELSQEHSQDASAQSIVQAGIALNILFQAGQKETPNGYLEEFSTEPFRISGPVPFTVKIKNNGNHYFTPKGVILIKNIFNQSVGRIDLQNANILVGTSRSLVGIPYNSSANKNQSPTSSRPVWPEKFLLGFYTAELSVALSEDGPVLTQTATFLAMPIHMLVGTGIGFVFILLIILRIRKKIKDL